jgi:hypothetical protein
MATTPSAYRNDPEGGVMRKSEFTCSAAMAGLLAGIPEDVEIESAAVFIGVKGGGVYMGSHLGADPEQIASMVSAFGEAKRSVMDGIIREFGMETMVTVMYFLASSHPDAKELEGDDFFKKYFVPKLREEG